MLQKLTSLSSQQEDQKLWGTLMRGQGLQMHGKLPELSFWISKKAFRCLCELETGAHFLTHKWDGLWYCWSGCWPVCLIVPTSPYS